MSTDWVQVAVALGFGFGVGGLLFALADPLSKGQQRTARAMKYPEAMTRMFTPGLLRAGGIGFMAFGVVGALMSLFFADKM